MVYRLPNLTFEEQKEYVLNTDFDEFFKDDYNLSYQNYPKAIEVMERRMNWKAFWNWIIQDYKENDLKFERPDDFSDEFKSEIRKDLEETAEKEIQLLCLIKNRYWQYGDFLEELYSKVRHYFYDVLLSVGSNQADKYK